MEPMVDSGTRTKERGAPIFTDFILNGQASSEVGQTLQECRFDPGLLRPYFDKDNRRCVTINTGRKWRNPKTGREEFKRAKFYIEDLQRRGINVPAANAVSLRRDAWKIFDDAVIMSARDVLRAWDDLSSANSFGGFDGMSKMTLEYEAMSDPGEAMVDMEGITQGRTDSPLFKTRSIPLPITHSDFWFSSRRLAVSRNTGTPLDTTMAEAAGRRVAEMIEKTLIGIEVGSAFGTDTSYMEGSSKVYGYTNFPYRLTKTDLSTPTGANPEAVMQDIIEMRQQLYDANFRGPYILYHTPAYDAFLDNDYFRSGSTAVQRTLRERLTSIEGIQDIRRLDFFTGGTYQMVMVQMTSDVARAINGMDITTVQWESQGGMRINFKVMAIQVPQLRFRYDGTAGILHATTS